MSEIDWSEAPEGAQARIDGDWTKWNGSHEYVWDEGKSKWISQGSASWPIETYKKAEIGFAVQERPTKPEPQAWDGEGLPPVGCECEFDDPAFGDWNLCTVKWIGREVIVVDRPEGGEFCTLRNAKLFRPLKSEQDRLREELLSFLEGNWLQLDKYEIVETILNKFNVTRK